MTNPRTKKALKMGAFFSPQAMLGKGKMTNRGKRWKWGESRKKCLVEGCNRLIHGLGYCNKHYKRFKDFGDPLITQRKTHRDSEGYWVYTRVRLP